MNFFKVFFASLLAFVVANIVLIVIGVMFIAGMTAFLGDSANVAVKPGSILKIDLGQTISEAPESSPFNSIDFGSMKIKPTCTILQALNAVEAASVDPNITGIYISSSYMAALSSANAEELRAEIVKFKESGKFVVSYSDVYSQLGYFLSSVADKVYMNPQGSMMWQGLASNVMFYKGLLDKLGVQPQVLRHGSFKAAVEPFIADKMSPENSLQINTLIGTVWGSLVSDIAASRGIDSALLQSYANDLAIKSPQVAVEKKLVDSLVYNDQMMSILNVLSGEDADSDDDPEFISLARYANAAKPATHKVSKNKIAVIYANGEIIDGESVSDKIGGNTIAAKLAKVRQDDNVKAVVLRVNSPGGSALASDIMWREVVLLKKDKPVIVSMGSVAASGGYYISCPADIILANKTTITGSIGVFGLMFNIENGLKNKLGITVDVAKTNPSADLGVPFRNLSSAETDYMMYQIESIYKTFVGNVADGRNLTFDAVDNIAGGRVWSGVSARQIGLIDGFGGIKQAIALAADRAGISDDFRVSQIIDQDDNFTALFKSLTSANESALRSQLGNAFVEYSHLMTMLNQQGVQARMPYTIDIR